MTPIIVSWLPSQEADETDIADAMRYFQRRTPECDHHFVDPANEVVESNGWEVCIKCGLLKEPA